MHQLRSVILALGATLSPFLALLGQTSPTTSSHPSVFPHVTDGAFTGNEWSDVPFTHFAASNSFLYADQADLDPLLGTPGNPYDTFMLMYDEVGLTTPLENNDYFLVSFTTVEVVQGV